MNAVEMKNEIENEMKVPDLEKSPQVLIKKSIKLFGGGVSYDTTIKCSEKMSKRLDDPLLKDTLDHITQQNLKEGVFKGNTVQKLTGKNMYPFNPSPLHPRIGLGHIHTMEPMEKFVAENIGGAIICCMCGNVEEGFGNNPTIWYHTLYKHNVWLCGLFYEPVTEDLRCCFGCNQDIVIKARFSSKKQDPTKYYDTDNLNLWEKYGEEGCDKNSAEAYFTLEKICYTESMDELGRHIDEVGLLFKEAIPILIIRKLLGLTNHPNMVVLEKAEVLAQKIMLEHDAEKEKAIALEKKKLAEQEKKTEQQKKKVAELEEQRRQQLTADLSWFEESKGKKKVSVGRVPKRPERVVPGGKGGFKRNDEKVAQWDFDYGKTHQHNGKPK